jgi:thiosulfate/3-mercaptopyruvate sulfurtransferase
VRSSPALFRSLVGLCCAATLSGAQQPAGSGRDALVVSPAWLAAHLHDANLVILHVGEPAAYASKHIAGARFVDLDDISDHSGMSGTPGANPLMLEMLPAQQLRAKLASLGISDNSRVVVYFANEWVSPSTRVMFTLDYAGLGNRSVWLDGGLDAWTRDGQPVTDVVPPPAQPAKLSALALKPIVVTADYVRAHETKRGVAIVDGRAAGAYEGVMGGNKANGNRAGHLPGAKSVPFTEVTDDQLKLKTPAQLQELFAKAGVQPADTVVGYCWIGQQATAMLFAARSLGHPVLLYDGSFEDYSKHLDWPIVGASAKRAP